MSPAAQKQVAAVVALLAAGGVLAFLALGGIEKNLIYFWDVEQLLEQGEKAHGATVRLGGLVQEGTLDWNAETLDLKFRIGIAAEGGKSVVVRSKGAPPQMFREGIGVVVEGYYDGEVFNAARVIVKHSNEYKAPVEGERPQDLYKTLVDE